MSLRYIMRNGEKVLQEYSYAQEDDVWKDVPTIEEPKKPREFFLRVNMNEVRCDAYPAEHEIHRYPDDEIIRVREVLDE